MYHIFLSVFSIIFFLLLYSPLQSQETTSLDIIIENVNTVLSDLQDQGFTAYKCEFHHYKIWVDVKINDKDANFLLDTGASFTFLNKKYVDDFNLRTRISFEDTDSLIFTFFGKLTDFEHRLAHQFKIAGHSLRPWPIIVHDSELKHGVLGVDFLHFSNAVIIPRFGLLLINISHQPAQYISEPLKASGYEEFDLTLLKTKDRIKWKAGKKEIVLESGVFVTEISFDSIERNVIIDTGAPFTTVYRVNVSKTDKKVFRHKSFRFTDAAGNITQAAGAFFDTLFINEYVVATNHLLLVSDDFNLYCSLGNTILPHIGVIGYDLLSKNNAIIDFGNRKLYLQK